MHGFKEEVIEKLFEALVICWNKIALAFFKSLINNMETVCPRVSVTASITAKRLIT